VTAPTGDHQITELGDGLRVVTESLPGVHSASIGVWIPVGSRDEQADQRGFAHLVEHMLFKGNERWDAVGISSFFDGIGSDANAATTKEYTVVHSRVLTRHLPATLDIFGEMILAPAFGAEDLNSEREVVLEEFAMYEDSPSDVAHELADSLVFDPHPLGQPIIGTLETVRGASPETMRGFHARHYATGGLVISAAGNIEHAAVVAAVRERFLAPAATQAPRLAAARASVTAPAGRARVVTKDTEQVHLCVAAPGIARSDERRYAAALLDTIFGSTPSSRLFREIRENRGLAYSVYSWLSHYTDAGELGVYVGVRSDRVREVLGVLVKELERIRRSPVDANELERAKDHLEGRMLLSLESTTVRGNRLGSALITGTPIDPVEETVRRLRAVSVADVQELAAELLDPARLSLAAVAQDGNAVERAAMDVLGVSAEALVAGDPPSSREAIAG